MRVFSYVADMAQIEIGEKDQSVGPSGAKSPHVSILMPAYNAARTLPDAVASVRAQTYADWELLIVDDASIDTTFAVANSLAETNMRIRVFRQARNGGAGAARNIALSAARGRYIAFLDADDLWLPKKLSHQIAFMQETGAALSYTGFWRVHADSGGKRRRAIQVPAIVDRSTLLRGNVIGCLTAVYDRSKLGDCPMPDMRLRQDFALWLEILSRTDVAYGLDTPLAVHQVRPRSLTSNRLRATRATWAMYRNHLGFPAHRAAWYLGQHLIRRLRRG